MNRILAMDLGGTWIRAAIVDLDDPKATLKVEKVKSPDNWEELCQVLNRFQHDELNGYALAASGPVDDHATLIQAPNVPWLDGRNLRRDIENAFGKPAILANDMEAATEGEMARGALRHYKWAIFDTISTGWGGNLVLGGQRVDGEPGHANVTFDTPERCGAGHVGCYESLYSGSALEAKIRKRLQRTGESRDDAWAYFNAEVESEDPWAISILDEWAEGVGRAWGNTLNRIRPVQAIVYMGTTAENLMSLPRVAAGVRKTIQTIAMFPEHRDAGFPILPAEFPERALYGAAVIFERLS